MVEKGRSYLASPPVYDGAICFGFNADILTKKSPHIKKVTF